VIRTVEVNGTHEPRTFSVWGAQAIASIGAQMDTLEDRAIVIGLRRKLPSEAVSELPVEYFEGRQNARRRLMRWARDNGGRIADLDLQPPPCGNDRARNNWAPLFRISAILGGPWPERVSAAYLAKEAGDDDRDETAGVMALRDVMAVFEDDAVDRIQSSVLVASLNEMPDRPWPEWRHGKSMTANSMARLLKPFGVRPRDLRFGTKNTKGYERTPVEAAFQRYCQAPPAQTATPRQSNEIKSLSPVQTATRTADVVDCNGALLHRTPFKRTPPFPPVLQLIFTLTGIPSAVNRLRQFTVMATSVFWFGRVWDLRVGPIRVLVRYMAVSARLLRW